MGALGRMKRKMSGVDYNPSKLALDAVIHRYHTVERPKEELDRGDTARLRYVINKYARPGELILLSKYLR